MTVEAPQPTCSSISHGYAFSVPAQQKTRIYPDALKDEMELPAFEDTMLTRLDVIESDVNYAHVGAASESFCVDAAARIPESVNGTAHVSSVKVFDSTTDSHKGESWNITCVHDRVDRVGQTFTVTSQTFNVVTDQRPTFTFTEHYLRTYRATDKAYDPQVEGPTYIKAESALDLLFENTHPYLDATINATFTYRVCGDEAEIYNNEVIVKCENACMVNNHPVSHIDLDHQRCTCYNMSARYTRNVPSHYEVDIDWEKS